MNSVDLFVLFTFSIFMLLGFLKGFLKEVLSVVTWLGASMVSTLFSNKIASYFGFGDGAGLSQASYQNLLVLAASFGGLFLVSILLGNVLTLIIAGVLQSGGASLGNRILGAAFGGLKGFIVVVVLMFIAELTPMSAQPAWVQSTFVKSFHPVVEWMQNMVNPQIQALKERAETAVQNLKMPDAATMLQSVPGR